MNASLDAARWVPGHRGVKLLEHPRRAAVVTAREMTGVPRCRHHADQHLHAFTRAFGLPEERLGARLSNGELQLAPRVSGPVSSRYTFLLKLTAMLDPWRREAAPVCLSLNGKTLFDGALFLENVCRGWPSVYFRVPPGLLRRGRNNLLLEHREMESALVLQRLELWAYDAGPSFSVIAAPPVVAAGERFTIVLRTARPEAVSVEPPPGWKQAGRPFPIPGGGDWHGFPFRASHPGTAQNVRFRLGRREAVAGVALVLPTARDALPALCGVEGNDLRHDETAEMDLVLRHLAVSGLGSLMVFRPVRGRNYCEPVSRATVRRWLACLDGLGAKTMYSHHWLTDVSFFREAAGFLPPARRGFLADLSHEPYMVLQKQWRPPSLAAASDALSAAGAYEQHLESIARKDGLTAIGEPSFLGLYARDANIRYILCEPVTNFTLLTASVRGACAGREKRFGYHLAPDWYFGWPNDEAKQRRLACALLCGFVAGGELFYLENALFKTNAAQRMDLEDPYPAGNRAILRSFQVFRSLHPRPGGEPRRRIAALYGRGNSAMWLHSDVLPELRDTVHTGGSGDGEASDWSSPLWGRWPDPGSRACLRVLDALAPPVPLRRRDPSLLKMFTGTPFGAFDMVQTWFDTLDDYRLLFFTGFNVMDAAGLDRLRNWVDRGGTLLLASAHLNAQPRPGAAPRWLAGRAAASLLGAELGSRPFDARAQGRAIRMLPLRARRGARTLLAADGGTPLVLEQVLGRGRVVLLNAADFPSLNALLPLYRRLLRREAEACRDGVTLRGSNRIFWAYYGNEERGLVQMVNAAWADANPARFEIVLHGTRHPLTLPPCGFAEVACCPAGGCCADDERAAVRIHSRTRNTLRLEWTALAPARLRFLPVSAQALALEDADGRVVPRQRDGTWRLPAASAALYRIRLHAPEKRAGRIASAVFSPAANKTAYTRPRRERAGHTPRHLHTLEGHAARDPDAQPASPRLRRPRQRVPSDGRPCTPRPGGSRYA